MRIGIVTDNYLPAVGGTEVSIVNYKRKLEELGHTVFVFCPTLGKNNPKPTSATTVRLPSIRWLYKEGPILYVYPGLTKKIRAYKLDILHSQSPMAAPYVATYLSRKLQIPHIHTMHTLLPEIVKVRRVSWGRQLLPYLAQSLVIRSLLPPKHYLLQNDKQALPLKVRISWAYLLRMVMTPDTVIFPSQHVLDIFISRGFTNHARLLPTFSNMFVGANYQKPEHHAASQPINIIHVGRLDPEKRPQVIIDAVSMLPRDINWRLTIVGGGSEQKSLTRRVKKYNLDNRVNFTGSLKQKAVANELIKGDIFVMASHHFDTQGIVLLEAAAAGLPIVYCDDDLTVGVELRNSLLTKPDVRSLTAGLSKLLGDPLLRRQMSLASVAVTTQYTPLDLTNRLLDFYSAAINDYRYKFGLDPLPTYRN